MWQRYTVEDLDCRCIPWAGFRVSGATSGILQEVCLGWHCVIVAGSVASDFVTFSMTYGETQDRTILPRSERVLPGLHAVIVPVENTYSQLPSLVQCLLDPSLGKQWR